MEGELKKGRDKKVRKSERLSCVWLIELPTSTVSLLRRGKDRHFVELVVNVMPQGKPPSLNLFDVQIFCGSTPRSEIRSAFMFRVAQCYAFRTVAATVWFVVGVEALNFISSLLIFMGAFGKLRKATVASSDLCLFVCPSFRMEQLGSHWMDFHEI
jgi:hypothetical protein